MHKKIKNEVLWLYIVASIFCAIYIAAIVIGLRKFFLIDNRIQSIEYELNIILSSNAQAVYNDLQPVVEFYKEQMQTLIWILGIIIGAAGAILAFIGINTRKAIDDKYNLFYNKLISAKDVEIYNKEIVILYKNNCSTIINFRNELLERGYNIKLLKASIKDVTVKTKNSFIVIYNWNEKDDTLYKEVAEWCESEHVYCIIYCAGEECLPKEFMSKKMSYVSTSIQITKLRESLYTLLYLAP